MPLNFSVIENFVAEYQDTMKDRGLLRGDRYRILAHLKDELHTLLHDYESFESELSTLVLHRIERTTFYENLRECHDRSVVGVENFFLEEDNISDVNDLFRIIRDAITIKVLNLVEEEMARDGPGRPPVEYAWVGMGSEGRNEQTMVTDQDNMIIYDEGKGGKEEVEDIERYFVEFTRRTVDRLHEVGFERCKGGVMPVNEKWRGSPSTWKERIKDRITNDKGSFESLDVIILTDARLVKGSKTLIDDVLAFFFPFLLNNKHFMKEFIQSAVLMPTAITFFRNFRVEKEGEFKGTFNIKLTGWSPLILSVRMLALNNGIFETNTLNRIKLLRKANIIRPDMEVDLIDAYYTFVRFRIMNQINNRADGGDKPGGSNHINPDTLRPDEQERIRKAMKSVEALQKYIQEVLLFGQSM